MIMTAHFLASLPTVSLFGVHEDLRDWILCSAPLAQFTLTRRPETSIAVYGDNYGRWLNQDYEINALHNLRTVLCLTHVCTSSYLDLLRLHVRHIIYPGLDYDAEAMALAVTPSHKLIPEEGRQFVTLQPDTPLLSVETYSVTNASDIETVLARTADFFTRHGHSSEQAAGAGLVVKEGITNCIFHAFRQKGSHERKYNPDEFSTLDGEDTVNVIFGKTDREIVMRIQDNSGSLAPLRIANSLDRQTTEQGIFDSRGRGFYLMRHLSDRAVLLVHRGISTATELYFLQTPGRSQGETLRHFELLEF